MRKLLLSLLLCLAISSLKAATYFVTPTGAGTNSGANWENAMTLAQAITAATSGDNIFVLKGTYTATSGSALINVTGTKGGVKLYGGFAGTETSLGQRVFGSTAADSTNFVGNGSRVIAHNGQTTAFTLPIEYDGFTIKGGSISGNTGGGMNNYYADVIVSNCIFTGNATTTSTGGGMHNTYNTVIVTNCKFYGNTANTTGAGMYNNQNTVTIINCTFSGNIATSNGGGVIISTNSSATVTDCKFYGNKSGGYGGGLATYDDNKSTTITITGCEFANNYSTSTTTGGGGLSNEGTNPTITNCIFSNNTATTNGGGMLNHTSAAPTISGCTFSGNSAASGGGIFNKEDISPVVTNSSFVGNSASSGAGIYIHSATSTSKFVNCLVAGNKATNAGGGVYATSATAKTCTPTFLNCTIAGNNAVNGGGIYSTGSATSGSTNPTITNCIVYGNKNGIVISTDAFSATATVTYSNVQFNNAGTSATYPELDFSGSGHNLNADPMFTNSPAYSGAPFITGDYTLQSNSANAVDKGLNSAIAISGFPTDLSNNPIDILGNPRIYNGGTVDMGAYEYQGVLPVTISTFTASLINNRTQLKWSVGTENKVNRYEIERSQNGIDFTKVTEVSANGSASYNATDNHPPVGVNYYRLVSIDNDGTIAVYAAIQTVKVTSLAGESVQVYPNPVKGNVINLTLNGYAAGNYTYKLVNAAGATVQQGNVSYGSSNVTIATTASAGVYVLYLSNGNSVIKAKLVKL